MNMAHEYNWCLKPIKIYIYNTATIPQTDKNVNAPFWVVD